MITPWTPIKVTIVDSISAMMAALISSSSDEDGLPLLHSQDLSLTSFPERSTVDNTATALEECGGATMRTLHSSFGRLAGSIETPFSPASSLPAVGGAQLRTAQVSDPGSP